jgi:hypothetical protein
MKHPPHPPNFPPLRSDLEKTEFLVEMHVARAELRKNREAMTAGVAALKLPKAPRKPQ